MRLAKISRTLLMLALPPVVATCAFAQANINPNTVRDQLNKPAQDQRKSSADPQAAPPSQGTSPARMSAPASAKMQSGKLTKTSAEKPAGDKPTTRRDPFETLLNKAKPSDGVPENLPPGKAGLQVEALRINGIVRGAGGMIAIVTNGQQRVYFLREGDKLYDGAVDKISLDSISFREFGKDAFGKPLEHQVTKRLYPSPGEQQ
jgi:hypothetical protein